MTICWQVLGSRSFFRTDSWCVLLGSRPAGGLLGPLAGLSANWEPPAFGASGPQAPVDGGRGTQAPIGNARVWGLWPTGPARRGRGHTGPNRATRRRRDAAL